MTDTIESLRAIEQRLRGEGDLVEADAITTAQARLEAAETQHITDMAYLGAADETIVELRTLLTEAEKPCIWTPQNDGDYWDTACGQAICFEVDGPTENEYDYCPGCGHPLMLVPSIEEVDIEDCATLAPEPEGQEE